MRSMKQQEELKNKNHKPKLCKGTRQIASKLHSGSTFLDRVLYHDQRKKTAEQLVGGGGQERLADALCASQWVPSRFTMFVFPLSPMTTMHRKTTFKWDPRPRASSWTRNAPSNRESCAKSPPVGALFPSKSSASRSTERSYRDRFVGVVITCACMFAYLLPPPHVHVPPLFATGTSSATLFGTGAGGGHLSPPGARPRCLQAAS